MLEKLKEIILDSQRAELVTGTQRQTQIVSVAGKATVCIGVRRSGKSTLMCQIMSDLLKKGVPRENILHLNFFDDRLHGLQQMGLGIILEAYFGLYPHKKESEVVYCFFDEIQIVPEWESFIDRIMRSEKCEVYITGSSAHLLSKEIATQMRGRALSWEVFPFSFQEFLKLKGIETSKNLSSKQRLTLQQAFDTFWETGGFPEVLNLEAQLRLKIHQEYFNAILFRDLVERHDISHPKAMSDLAHRLIDNIASFYSINGLMGYLKSLGHKISKEAVSNYLTWFEDAYFLFSVRLFDASLSRSHANPKKVYCIDHSMITSISSGILVNTGHLLENLVFTTLRRIVPDIFYFKTSNGKEVDFIIQKKDRTPVLIQVCESIADPQTRKREISALEQAMSELNVAHGYIITRRDSEEITVQAGKLHVMPVWRFLWESCDTAFLT